MNKNYLKIKNAYINNKTKNVTLKFAFCSTNSNNDQNIFNSYINTLNKW